LRESVLNGTHVRHRLPVTGEKTIARFIWEMEEERNAWVSTPRKPCFVIPRVLIGPEESSPEEVTKQAVDGLDPMSFHTLRYRKFNGKIMPYPGKCVIDATGYMGKAIVANPHKILPRYCIGDANPQIASALLKVHHYTGSFETFASHRGNNMSVVSKVSTQSLPQIFYPSCLKNTCSLLIHDDRCGKKGLFGHPLVPTMMCKVGSSLLWRTWDWTGPRSLHWGFVHGLWRMTQMCSVEATILRWYERLATFC
jgi:hypothetical protein